MGIPIPGKDGLYIETGPRNQESLASNWRLCLKPTQTLRKLFMLCRTENAFLTTLENLEHDYARIFFILPYFSALLPLFPILSLPTNSPTTVKLGLFSSLAQVVGRDRAVGVMVILWQGGRNWHDGWVAYKMYWLCIQLLLWEPYYVKIGTVYCNFCNHISWKQELSECIPQLKTTDWRNISSWSHVHHFFIFIFYLSLDLHNAKKCSFCTNLLV